MSIPMNQNTVVYQTRLHWIVFTGPILLILAAIILYHYIPQFKEPTLAIAAFAVIWGGMTWSSWHFSSLIIKNRQIILRSGILVRKTVDIPLNKIESIDITQSILGSLMGFGSLVITGTGGTKHVMDNLSGPLTCRRHIEQLMHQ